MKHLGLLLLIACKGPSNSTPDAASPDASNPDGAVDAQLGYTKLPCTETFGTGAGTFDASSIASNPGDVLCLEAGTYEGGTIEHLSDRVIQNDGGVVVITGVVRVGNLVNVTFSGSGNTGYGFQLSGVNASMVITGPNTNLTVHDFEAVNAGILLDAGHTSLTWTGTPDSDGNPGLVLYKSKLDRIHLSHSMQLFQGNYGAPSLFVNFASDVEMANVIVENSAAQGQIVVAAGGFFNANVHDWTITGMNDVVVGSNDDRDCGVFIIVGNGSFKRIHRVGGWGWLVRTFGATLGASPGEFHCEDNVDLGTEYYGTCEVRNEDDPSYLVDGKLSTLGIFIANNVSANKGDIKGGYTTAIGLIPNLKAGTTATLTGNVGCNNANDYGDVDSLHFFLVNGTVVNTNNQQLTSCAGITDPITGAPL